MLIEGFLDVVPGSPSEPFAVLRLIGHRPIVSRSIIVRTNICLGSHEGHISAQRPMSQGDTTPLIVKMRGALESMSVCAHAAGNNYVKPLTGSSSQKNMICPDAMTVNISSDDCLPSTARNPLRSWVIQLWQQTEKSPRSIRRSGSRGRQGTATQARGRAPSTRHRRSGEPVNLSGLAISHRAQTLPSRTVIAMIRGIISR